MMYDDSKKWQGLLSCPRCKSPLSRRDQDMICAGVECRVAYPLVNGIPILINDDRSVFSVTDFIQQKSTTFSQAKSGGVHRLTWLRKLIPSNSRPVGDISVGKFLSDLPGSEGLVLVVGSGDRRLKEGGKHTIIYTDVHIGPEVNLIADSHDLPFLDESLDAVVVDSVLEHVLDPVRCVSEIERVLKPRGRVFAITPFMQQVHLGRYDFTRFTHLGHRHLFWTFDELQSGIMCGPGMALAWAWQYFLLSFSESIAVRRYLRALAKLTSFPLPLFDHYLKNKKGAYDCASAFYFIGERSLGIAPGRNILNEYRGLDNL